MFRFLILACILGVGLSAPTDYDDLDLPILGIIGGEATFIHEYPYQISLEYNGKHTCGGAIIGNKLVITASHCTIGKEANKFLVRAGTTSTYFGGDTSVVKEIKNHPLYNGDNHTHDIAVLFLETPLPYSANVQPIDMADVNDKIVPGEYGIVSGWGRIFENGAAVNVLRQTKVPLHTDERCKAAYGKRITDSMFCAGEEGKDACQADSGGPLACNGKLCGVVSWGIGCGRSKYPGVYTNVAYVRPWVEETIKNGPK